MQDPAIDGQRPCDLAEQVRRPIERYRALQEINSLLGIEALSAADRKAVGRAWWLIRVLTQPFAVTAQSTGRRGVSFSVKDMLKGCEAIIAGEADKWEESAPDRVGTLGDALKKENAGRGAA